LKKADEERISAFEMKYLRMVLRASWTAKKTNEWVLNAAGVERILRTSVKEAKMTILRAYSEVKRELPGKGDYPGCNTRFQSQGQTEDNMAGLY